MLLNVLTEYYELKEFIRLHDMYKCVSQRRLLMASYVHASYFTFSGWLISTCCLGDRFPKT